MKSYRTGRIAALAALMVLLAAALALVSGALRARFLIRTVLDGRRARAQAESRVSQFDLSAEMLREQTQFRISGWLNIAPGEEITTQTARGNLAATVYPAVYGGQNAPWALVLHGGLGTERTQVQDIACALSLSGYRVLTPDLYAHGKSDGEISSLGMCDAQDVQAWVQWILMEDADAQIVIFGQDEGAVAALRAAQEGLPAQVAAIAADSAFTDPAGRALSILQEEGFSALDSALFVAAYRVLNGALPDDGQLLERAGDINIPVLILHGTGDQDVPAWNGEDIASAIDGAQMLLIEGAGHGMARYLEPEIYYSTLEGFFADALAEKE